jgi:transposase-like protein
VIGVRKRYPADFKAQVVLEILREEKSISQISSEYGVHPNQLNRWKNQVVNDLPRLFSDEHKKTEGMKGEYEKRLEELYAEVGRLTTQLNWLKKKGI